MGLQACALCVTLFYFFHQTGLRKITIIIVIIMIMMVMIASHKHKAILTAR